LAEPSRKPWSAPLVAWNTRTGRYQGIPQSHSMSLSKPKISPSAFIAMS
jgi:hypothetical protein